MGCHAHLQGIFPTQGLNLSLPHCRQILYGLSHLGKPQNTGVGSLSLRQGNFLIQELNQVLLHCGWILYQLSYQGGPVRAGHMRNFAAAWSIPPLNHPAGVYEPGATGKTPPPHFGKRCQFMQVYSELVLTLAPWQSCPTPPTNPRHSSDGEDS